MRRRPDRLRTICYGSPRAVAVKAAACPRPDADGLFDPDVSHGQALGAAMFHYRQESVICKSHRTRIMPGPAGPVHPRESAW